MDNTVKKKLSVFRKRQTVFVIIYGLINAVVIAGIIVYYRLKEQVLAGALYLQDNAYGEAFVRKMFSSGITDNNIRAGRTAMESAGYGSHGFSYMSRLNGEMYALIAIIVVLLIALGSGLYNCYRLGHKGFVKKVCDVYADNERLSKQLDNEHIYNKEQYQKMQDFIENIAHQIKTPIFALRLLLQEEPERNRESLAQLFRIEQYVEMVLGYLRTEDMSADLKLARSSLDRIIREQIHKYAGIFVAKKLSLSYEGTDATVLTDEKWLGFVIGQILSNALKYTRTGGIEIWLEDERGNRTSNTAPAILVIADTGIGIQAEDLPRIFEKGYTGVNGREDNRATGIGLYLSRKILKKLGHEITVDSQVDKGTEVRLSLWKKELEMY